MPKPWWERVRPENRTLLGYIRAARFRVTAGYYSIKSIAKRVGLSSDSLSNLVHRGSRATLSELPKIIMALARDIGMPARVLREACGIPEPETQDDQPRELNFDALLAGLELHATAVVKFSVAILRKFWDAK